MKAPLSKAFILQNICVVLNKNNIIVDSCSSYGIASNSGESKLKLKLYHRILYKAIC